MAEQGKKPFYSLLVKLEKGTVRVIYCDVSDSQQYPAIKPSSDEGCMLDDGLIIIYL